MGEGTLQVIRGDLNEPITIEDATHAIGRIFTTREEEAGEGTTEDGVALDAQSVRYQRSSSGGIYTPDEIRAAFPDLTDDQVKQQVALQAVLDIYNETQNPNIGSVQLTSELRRRGMDPTDAARYAKWTVDNGLGTYSDLWAVGGAVVGGVAGSYAGRWIPTFTARVSPRLTTGVLRGFAEETGEETGEIFAEVIATAVSGGNPVGILLDPSTYAYAGGSILFSGVTEADNPNARPRPEAVPSGAEGAGAVFSTTGSVVDPEVVAEGNRLLDRWSASNSEFNRYLNGSPPPGVDLATWNRRGAALARDVRSSGDALSQFRADNSGLVVGYSGGGGTVVVTADNSLAVVSPDGQASLYAYAPGDATFMMPSGGVDARTIFGIDDAGRLVPVGPETPGGAVDTVSGGSDVSVPLGSPDADDDPAVGFDATRGSPSSAQGNLGGTAAPPSQVAPVPTAALSEPLPLGQAEPAPQTTTPTPTEPKGQGDSRDGRSAPPGVRDPGGPSFTPPPSPPPSPQPSSAAQASPAPQPTPRTSPSPSITPTPNPDPGRGTQSQPGPGSPQGGTPGTLTQQTAPGTSPLTQPGPAPATQPIPVPTVGPQPFGTPSAVGQPTASDPTPANIPDVTPTPTPTTETQPGTQPQPEPSITPTITTTETPTITPTPRPRRRRRRGDDETPRRREIPNPVADDPNRHPREVQFVDRNLHTVDLVTGEHTIEPLDDEQLRTIHIRSFSPENPQGQVHLAGSVQLEVERQRIVAESADRRKDAGDPIDYRDINFVSGQGPARPSAQDLSGIQLRQSPGQLDYRDVNFVEGQGPSRSSARDLSRIQLPDQRNQGSGQQLDYRDINFVDREPSRSGSSGKSKSSGRGGKSTGGKSTGGKSGDGSNINYRPGQGPAPAANRRSANNVDTGLMNGGGAAGRRRGGGRRRKDEDEDERGYRRPVIQVVLEG